MTDHNYQISFASSMTKLNWGIADRKPQVQTSTDLTIHAVRNEVTGFQILIDADHEFVLVLDHANWLHPLGFKPRLRLEIRFPDLQQENIECFPVGYVEGDDRRWWMETLERAGWAEVPPNRTQAVFFRLRIPSHLSSRSYDGTLSAFTQFGFEDEVLYWQGAIKLNISPVMLPDYKDFRFHLNLWQHCTSISRYHRVPLWSDAHFTLIDRYFASLAQLGQKAVSVIVAEIPWSGQKCFRDPAYPSYLFEHAIIDVSRTSDRKLVLDFTNLDRLLAVAARYGMDREIDLFGLLNIWTDEQYGFGKISQDAPDAVRIRCYDEVNGTFTYLRSASELRQFIRMLQDHFSALGLLGQVRIAADEPSNLEAFNKSLEFIQQAAPGFLYNAAINHFEFIENAPESVSDFIPVLPLACREPEKTILLTRLLHERGGKMLWYVCCGPPIPNTFIHSPLVESRLIGWLTHYLNLDGFLRWAFCLWPSDPWRRVSFRAPGWSAGDMFFVLPGNDGAPVETLRYEALRTAVQDYELLRMIREKISQTQADHIFLKAFNQILRTSSISDFANVDNARPEELYSLDPSDYDAARQIIIKALEEAL